MVDIIPFPKKSCRPAETVETNSLVGGFFSSLTTFSVSDLLDWDPKIRSSFETDDAWYDMLSLAVVASAWAIGAVIGLVLSML